MTSYEIPSWNLGKLQKKIDSLAKAAERCGVSPPTMVVGEAIERALSAGIDRPKKVYKVYPVTIEGDAPTLNGWRFVATLSHTEEGVLLFTVPGETLGEWYKDPESAVKECDYCAKRRNRKGTFVVRSATTNDERIVGRNCLKDFLGHPNPHAIAEFSTSLAALFDAALRYSEYDDEGIGRGAEPVIDLIDYLAKTSAVVRHDGCYISRRMVDEDPYKWHTTTGWAAWSDFWAGRGPHFIANKGDRDVAASVATWVEMNLKAKDWSERNDYEQNVVVAFELGYVKQKTAGIVASAIAGWRRAQREAAPKVVVEKSQWVGEVGQKIEVIARVNAINPFQSEWGGGNTVKMEDADGNLFVTFINSKGKLELQVGEWVQVKGKVKAHNSWKGQKETQLNYVKLSNSERAGV